jgi:peptidoglycan/LPS O-acetylase OafA/YrhL
VSNLKVVALVKRARRVAAVALSIVGGLSLATGPALANDAPPPEHYSNLTYLVIGGVAVVVVVLVSWLLLRLVVIRKPSRHLEEYDDDG